MCRQKNYCGYHNLASANLAGHLKLPLELVMTEGRATVTDDVKRLMIWAIRMRQRRNISFSASMVIPPMRIMKKVVASIATRCDPSGTQHLRGCEKVVGECGSGGVEDTAKQIVAYESRDASKGLDYRGH